MKRMLAALVLLIILACALSCARAQEVPQAILDWMAEHGYENESWHSLQFDLPDGSACAFLLNDWSLYARTAPHGRMIWVLTSSAETARGFPTTLTGNGFKSAAGMILRAIPVR